MSGPEALAPGAERPEATTNSDRYRLATIDDVDGIETVERSCFASPWPRAALLQEVTDIPWSRTLVCERGGRVVAFMMYWLVGPELHLLNLAVAPARRGQGIARRLVQRLIDLARTSHREEIILEVRPSNAVARRLYESLGFTELTVRRGYYPDNGEDALVMGLKLGQNGD